MKIFIFLILHRTLKMHQMHMYLVPQKLLLIRLSDFTSLYQYQIWKSMLIERNFSHSSNKCSFQIIFMREIKSLFRKRVHIFNIFITSNFVVRQCCVSKVLLRVQTHKIYYPIRGV